MTQWRKRMRTVTKRTIPRFRLDKTCDISSSQSNFSEINLLVLLRNLPNLAKIDYENLDSEGQINYRFGLKPLDEQKFYNSF